MNAIGDNPLPIIRFHDQCGGPNLRVLTAKTESGGEIEVGRCMVCDTAKCPKCAGRVIDPSAKACPHCGADVQIKLKAGEEADDNN